VAETALLLGLVELGLRAFGYGHSTRPFLEKTYGTDTWHILNDRYYDQFLNVDYNPQRYDFPGTTIIRTPKPEGTFRVFVFGGSAAFGWFFSDYCMGNILEVMLRNTYPLRRFEVITVAYPALNSFTMRYLAEACSQMQPDLFLVYMGNNEIMGPYGLQSAVGSKYRSATAINLIVRINLLLSDVRLFQLFGIPARSIFSKSVEHLKWGGYAGIDDLDDPRLERVYTLFRSNLEHICASARSADAQTALCTVGYNLRDWPPEISTHSKKITAEERDQWNLNYQSGDAEAEKQQYETSLGFYERAAAIDDMHAGLMYKLARCYRAVGDYTRARDYYYQAADQSLNFSSANRQINGIIRETASCRSANGVRLIDTEGALARQSPDGVPGTESFYDQVHLRFEGNYIIAAEIFKNIKDLLQKDNAAGRENPEPPSLEQCKQLMGYSPGVLLNELRQVTDALQNSSSPPDLQAPISRLEPQVSEDINDTILEGYHQALMMDEENALVRYRYVELLNTLGRAEEALESAQLLVGNVPLNWRYSVALILALLDTHRGGAYERSEALTALYPEYAGIQEVAGTAALGAGHLDQAIRHFKNAVDLNGHYAYYHRKLGSALALNGNFSETKSTFENTLKIDSTQTDAIAGALRTAVYKFQETGNWNKAVEGLRTILQLQPDADEIRLQLVEALCALKEYDTAWKEIGECQKQSMDIPEELMERLKHDSGRDQ
jgi:tetratricopeptide (TPR) repeat protein